MRQFRLALGFLTRLPAGRLDCTAKDIGQSARWFPLVGAVLGAIYAGTAWLLRPYFPRLVAAAIITALDAVLTGVMHFDGLADTADGFGAGRTREDVLRIMRDPAIGSYGACALFLALVFKVAAIGAFIGGARAVPALLLTPVLGRWSAVFSSALARYARAEADDAQKSVGSPARFIGRTELIIASVTAAPFALPMWRWRGVAAMALAAAATAGWTYICKRRIGGVTGDTLGASVEMTECLVLVAFAAWS